MDERSMRQSEPRAASKARRKASGETKPALHLDRGPPVSQAVRKQNQLFEAPHLFRSGRPSRCMHLTAVSSPIFVDSPKLKNSLLETKNVSRRQYKYHK